MATREKGGFSAVKAKLVEKMKWKPPRLSQVVGQYKRLVPMSTPVAYAVIAHDKSINFSRFLSAAELAEVSAKTTQIAAIRGASSGNGKPTTPATQRSGRGPREIVIRLPSGLRTSHLHLQSSILAEATEMAAFYPALYVLENSIRGIIHNVMAAKYGADWHLTHLSSGKAKGVLEKGSSRLDEERRRSWHQRRGARFIDYVDFPDLYTIAASKPDLFFTQVLGTQKWFEGLIDELTPSRNVLCHMNPLDRTNGPAILLRLDHWHQHVKARDAEIRAAMASPGPVPKSPEERLRPTFIVRRKDVEGLTVPKARMPRRT